MAVRVCVNCEELMQEGYVVTKGNIKYFCSDRCLYNTYTLQEAREMDKTEPPSIAYHEWAKEACDEEDYFNLMNVLLSDPTPSQIANVMDILNREDPQNYMPHGVLWHFTNYLNEQGDVIF